MTHPQYIGGPLDGDFVSESFREEPGLTLHAPHVGAKTVHPSVVSGGTRVAGSYTYKRDYLGDFRFLERVA